MQRVVIFTDQSILILREAERLPYKRKPSVIVGEGVPLPFGFQKFGRNWFPPPRKNHQKISVRQAKIAVFLCNISEKRGFETNPS